MKKWLAGMALILGLASCHPAGQASIAPNETETSTTMNDRIEVTGEAGNAKAGALVSTEAGGYYVDGLSAWPDSLLGRKVMVQGRLKIVIHRAEDLQNERGEWSQGMVGEQRILLEATWRLQD